MSSYKNRWIGCAIACCALLLVACNDKPAAKTAFQNDVRNPDRGGAQAAEPIDLGQNWDRDLSNRSAQNARSGSSAPADGTFWTILLKTYTGPEHARAAANTVHSSATLDPKLGQANVYSDSKGSRVIFGQYESVDDPVAQRDLAWIKGVTIREMPVFPTAMLTRIDVSAARGVFRPNELLGVRKKYPNVDPLYTVQVAAWGDFESGEISLAEVQRRAEQQTQELRAKGWDAYFHHDPDKRLSVVTVGLFGSNAWDAASGLYAPEVQQILNAFPQHLVNGEPLREPINPKFPSRGMRWQPCQVVVVPEL